MKSPFKRAKDQPLYVRGVLYGAEKTGKTKIGLSFPRVAVFDTEDGTRPYANAIDFFSTLSQSLDDLHATIDYLLADEHEQYKTFLLDSITPLYTNLVSWGTGEDGRVSYDRWAHIHNTLESVYNRLALLPMHVIVTAHETTRYVPMPNGQKGIQRAGVKPDADDALPYFGHVTVRVARAEKGDGREYGGYIEHLRGINLARPIYRANISFDMLLKAAQFSEQKSQNGGVEPAQQPLVDEEQPA